jgi:tRNA modification GTPase
VGAIAVIRVSGQKAVEIGTLVFSKNLNDAPSHTAHFGVIKSERNEVIDEVLITVFQGNKSFTGEPTLEIACHGSTYIQQQILQLLVRKGCRLAQPGEFTFRAFMNGKMDLSQAEAVADLIHSESKKAHDLAILQMKGKFSSELKELREQLIHFASLVELELDFAEEDVEFADRSELKQLVTAVIQYIQRLIDSFELGNAIKNGVPVAIVGAPNTGKSTLLNQLLKEDRAIVSNIAGTTRDVIEETLNIDGILFRLIDTAGIREHAEEIEALGIEKSKEKIKQAQLVLVLSDAAVEASTELGHGTMPTSEAILWAEELQKQYPTKKIAVVANKIDLTATLSFSNNNSTKVIGISAKQGVGLEELQQWMVNQIQEGFDITQETIITNARHVAELDASSASLKRALNALENGVSADFVAMDIRQAMFHLGSITGQISEDDLLANIFSKFCIGK